MSRSTVLGTAAALHVFTAEQVAAYCEDDPDTVRAILDDHRDLFEPVPGANPPRWRVTDPLTLRAAVAAASGPSRAKTPREAAAGSLEARLLLAEQTLIDCTDGRSAAERRVMAATAKNYLRQFLAGALRWQHELWWEILPSYLDNIHEPVSVDGTAVSPCRLRTDLRLAHLTESQAARQNVGKDFLVDTATELDRLLRSREMEEDHVQRLSGWFTTLAMALTSPQATNDRGTAAPARLLCALAWKRAGPVAQGGWEPAAAARIDLLRGFAEHDSLVPDGETAHLCRVMGRLQHGRQRVAVYQDLLGLLPSGIEYEPVEPLLPGAVVAAVTDASTAQLLQRFADILERDLVSSPYSSIRALVGQVAHRFDEFQTEIGGDGTAVTRTIETRKELLALFDVPAVTEPRTPWQV